MSDYPQDDYLYLDPYERFALIDLGLLEETGEGVYAPTQFWIDFCEAYRFGFGDAIEHLKRWQLKQLSMA